jgi:hypothetical protein
MRESILKHSRWLERCGNLAQAVAECYRKVIELLIWSLKGRELLQDLSKLVLEIVHRLEHFGQMLDLHLELPERLKYICQLGKLVHRFNNIRDLSELLLQWSHPLKNR